MTTKLYRLPVNPGTGVNEDFRRPAGVDDCHCFETQSDHGDSFVVKVEATDEQHAVLATMPGAERPDSTLLI